MCQYCLIVTARVIKTLTTQQQELCGESADARGHVLQQPHVTSYMHSRMCHSVTSLSQGPFLKLLTNTDAKFWTHQNSVFLYVFLN